MRSVWQEYRKVLERFGRELRGEKREIFMEILSRMEKDLGEKIERYEKERKIKDLLYRVFEMMVRSLERHTCPDGFLTYVLKFLGEAFGAERGFYLLHPKYVGKNLRFIYFTTGRIKKATINEIECSFSIISHILSTGEPVCIMNAVKDERFKESESIKKLNILSVLAFPMKDKYGDIKGILYFDSRNVENLFSDEHVEIGKKVIEVAERFLEHFYPEALRPVPFIYRGVVIGRSERMGRVFSRIRKLAKGDFTVLFTGESGVGKEVFAKLLHEMSPRREKPFVPIHCAAIPENLIESELFGYAKGAFTGAVRPKRGKVETAEGGTVFLDEIGDLSPGIQVKLLRFIEYKEFTRLGENVLRKADIRFICATHHNLEKLVEEGKFRKDLYYRINTAVVEIPPLRKRKEDIPVFVNYFASRYKKKVSPEVMRILLEYNYPGNVRELENIIKYASTMSEGNVIREEHLPLSLRERKEKEVNERSLDEIEKIYILEILRDNNWNISKTARELGISRTTLYTKMKRYGIERE
ncbi:sigma-54-dependent Fis family transcriptional regulator [bacterium]|nr:MAG: sigma-54-dependent Fis family transcriptional regulator [bacterium]